MANSGSSTGGRGSGLDRPQPARSACSNAGRRTLSTIWCRRPEKSSKFRTARSLEADNVSGHAHTEDRLVRAARHRALCRARMGRQWHAMPIAGTDAKMIQAAILQNVEAGSTIHTDEAGAYVLASRAWLSSAPR